MPRLIDGAINILKWPSAALSVVVLPKALWAVAAAARNWVIVSYWSWLAFFVGGFLLYWTTWRWLRGTRGSLLFTLEHELTHALFAWGTGHQVTNLRATWRRGGSVTVSGPGNWLIVVAPYFFPTVFVPLFLVGLLTPWLFRPLLDLALGAALAFHLHSSVRELHAKQTDLQQVGFAFSALFLPTANLLALGSVISYSAGGFSDLVSFWKGLFT